MAKFLSRKFLVCDDVRVEATGKFFIIGLYPGNVVRTAIPGDLIFSAYLEIEADEEGLYEGEFRLIRVTDAAVVGGGPARIEFSVGGIPHPVFFRFVVMRVDAPGEYAAEWKAAGDTNWQNLGRIPVSPVAL